VVDKSLPKQVRSPHYQCRRDKESVQAAAKHRDIPLLIGTNAATLVDRTPSRRDRHQRLCQSHEDGKLIVDSPSYLARLAPIILATPDGPSDQSVFLK